MNKVFFFSKKQLKKICLYLYYEIYLHINCKDEKM